MTAMTEIIIQACYIGCILFTIISIIYSYGRLNHEYNYKDGIEVDYKTWNANRNICVVIAIGLNIVLAVYFWINLNPYTDNQSNYKLFKAKEDPLYHQIVEEKPNSFWKGPSSIADNIGRLWRNI